jgi:hypothetical protein
LGRGKALIAHFDRMPRPLPSTIWSPLRLSPPSRAACQRRHRTPPRLLSLRINVLPAFPDKRQRKRSFETDDGTGKAMHRLVERQLQRAHQCRSFPTLKAKEPEKCNQRGMLLERTADLLQGSLQCIRESEMLLASMKVAEAPDEFQRVVAGCEEVIRSVMRGNSENRRQAASVAHTESSQCQAARVRAASREKIHSGF